MSIMWRDEAGTLRTAGSVYFRATDGLKSVDEIRVRQVDGTMSLVYKRGLSLAVSPAEAGGFTTLKLGPVTTNAVTVSCAGGNPPYNYAWIATSGVSIGNPTEATTAFTATPPGVTGSKLGTATCTVTDQGSLTAQISVPLDFERDS